MGEGGGRKDVTIRKDREVNLGHGKILRPNQRHTDLLGWTLNSTTIDWNFGLVAC